MLQNRTVRAGVGQLRRLGTARVLSKGPYDNTLLLPKTKFPMRANAAQREPKIAACFQDIYHWQRDANSSSSSDAGPAQFIMHDGPPFANGPPHMGHALNKILKDIINRYHMLRGR
eukprot:gene1005-17001_t